MAKIGKIKFYGEIYRWSSRGAKSFTDQLEALASKNDSIEIHLHSYGGEVFEGNVIYNAIANCPVPVKIIIDGVAASMGSIIMLPAAEREMVENGFIMIHNPSGGAWGNATKLRSAAELLEKMEVNFQSDYAAATGQSEEEFKKLMDGQDHWLTAKEALAKGLITKIIPRKVNVSKLDKTKVKDLGVKAVYGMYSAALEMSTNFNIEDSMKLKEMALALGLPEDATEEQILAEQKRQSDERKQLLKDTETAEANTKRQQLAVALGLDPKATEAEITAEQKKQATELAALRQEKVQREQAEATAQTAADNKMLDDAVKDGRIDAGSRESWSTMLAENRAHAMKVFPKGRQPISAQLSDGEQGEDAFEARFKEIRGEK